VPEAPQHLEPLVPVQQLPALRPVRVRSRDERRVLALASDVALEFLQALGGHQVGVQGMWLDRVERDTEELEVSDRRQ
jgi:hypothetical protein